eukprot:gene17179-biopygen20347
MAGSIACPRGCARGAAPRAAREERGSAAMWRQHQQRGRQGGRAASDVHPAHRTAGRRAQGCPQSRLTVGEVTMIPVAGN